MKLYDISQELFGCVVFPGDPAPKREILSSMQDGSNYNLTALSLCAHNGTHVDAPYHFIKDGKTVEKIDLARVVGLCFVIEHKGILSAKDAMAILDRTQKENTEAAKRLLFKGNTTVSTEAAEVFAEGGIWLLGNESQTVGPEDGPMAAHLALLSREVVLLEGIRLSHVPEEVYLLNAAPIALGGADGAPCRAILMDMEGEMVC
ncbi:MAG: cyclase family protein [Clostridia bacterium]|nr:cyclase family protein [Clostridia bacterium]